MEPAGAKAIDLAVKQDEYVLRFLLAKTVRENTMVPKKVLQQKRAEDGSVAKPEEKVEEKPVLSAEELDKTIDDLVIS